MAMYRSALVSLGISILVNSLFYAVLKQPEIATVDIVSITSEFIKTQALKKQTKPEREAAIKTFSHQLEGSLAELSSNKRLILVPKEAIIKGSKDYTAVLRDKVGMDGSS